MRLCYLPNSFSNHFEPAIFTMMSAAKIDQKSGNNSYKVHVIKSIRLKLIVNKWAYLWPSDEVLPFRILAGLLRLRLFFRAILAQFLKIYDSRHLPESGDAALRGQNDCIGEIRLEIVFNIEFNRMDIREVFSRVDC